MKKFISLVLVLTMALCLFAGCNNNQPTEPDGTTDASPLESAKEYVYAIYKDNAVETRKEYSVVDTVMIDGVSFSVTWAVSVSEDLVQIVADKDNNAYTIIPTSENTDPVDYTLTATVTDANGQSVTVSFERRIPAGTLTAEQIVEKAYTLTGDDIMEGYELTGVITEITTAYDESYKNITVVIQIGELADKPITCYRLKGDGAAALAVGDKITVSGNIKNNNGTIEFDSGCELKSVVAGELDQSELLKASYALAPGEAMPDKIALLGTITSIDTEWSEQYQNITVTIVCGGLTDYPIQCFRLKGEGAATLAVGQEIAVYGTMKNYQSSSTGTCTIEFDAGCQLITMAEFTTLFNPVPPTAAEPEPTEPDPTDPEPTDPTPTETEPTDPTPTEPTPSTGISVVATPETGKAYKFGMVQGNVNNKIFYLAGGMNGYFLATTEDSSAALDVYLESVDGGYHLYCLVDGAKTYINFVVSADGAHVNGAYEATASTVYRYDAESKTVIASVDGDDYWLATRNDKTYTTMGPCKVSYNGFYGQFYG